MIYFFYGQDKAKIHKKASKVFESLRAKKPDASFFSFDAENISTGAFEGVALSQGLFEKKVVVYFRNILSESDLEKKILSEIPNMAKSENIFIWTEYHLLKEPLSLLKKNSEKSDIEEKDDFKAKKEEFNMFALAEAFGKRDKKNLWALYQKARAKGSAEEIHGILFWQLKCIALASSSKTATEADLKPFVFSKAKSFAKNFSPDEIKKLSEKLVEIYHNAHRGKMELDLALEEFILSL